VGWLRRVTPGRMVGGMQRRIPVVLLLMFVVLLGPALANGSSVDPTWIAGFWDAADQDDELLAAAGLEATGDPCGPTLFVHHLPVVGRVRPADPASIESAPNASPSIRAPPAA